MRVMVGLGMVLLITQLILKTVSDGDLWFKKRRFAVMNVVLASE
jgi:lipopolysaccharide/colanic/teichoic acid biosynthesis glycosyltransferase